MARVTESAAAISRLERPSASSASTSRSRSSAARRCWSSSGRGCDRAGERAVQRRRRRSGSPLRTDARPRSRARRRCPYARRCPRAPSARRIAARRAPGRARAGATIAGAGRSRTSRRTVSATSRSAGWPTTTRSGRSIVATLASSRPSASRRRPRDPGPRAPRRCRAGRAPSSSATIAALGHRSTVGASALLPPRRPRAAHTTFRRVRIATVKRARFFQPGGRSSAGCRPGRSLCQRRHRPDGSGGHTSEQARRQTSTSSGQRTRTSWSASTSRSCSTWCPRSPTGCPTT